MNSIQTLLADAFDVRLVHRDGVDSVEVKRTDASAMSPKTAGAFVKDILQHQDEAVEWFREQLRADWVRLAAGLDGASELDEAIAIHELALWWDGDECSDGTSHRAHIESLLGIASRAGAEVRLSSAASGRLNGRAVRHSEMAALAA